MLTIPDRNNLSKKWSILFIFPEDEASCGEGGLRESSSCGGWLGSRGRMPAIFLLLICSGPKAMGWQCSPSGWIFLLYHLFWRWPLRNVHRCVSPVTLTMKIDRHTFLLDKSANGASVASNVLVTLCGKENQFSLSSGHESQLKCCKTLQ